VADSSNAGNGSRGGAVVCAAVLLVVGYALVNQEKLPRLARHLPGFLQSQAIAEPDGKLRKDLSETVTQTFYRDGKECILETYWANGRMHYRARAKVTPERYDRFAASEGKRKPAMTFSLRNRFGEERILVEIAADQFRRECSPCDEVTASGSVPAAEADYRECVDSQESRSFNRFAD
jgi:hypothetical protein